MISLMRDEVINKRINEQNNFTLYQRKTQAACVERATKERHKNVSFAMRHKRMEMMYEAPWLANVS